MDPITRPAAPSFHRPAVATAKHLHQAAATLARRNGVSRRCLLALLTSTAAIPGGSESRKALLQGERETDQTFPGLEELVFAVPLHAKLMQLVRPRACAEYLKKSKENKEKNDKEVTGDSFPVV